MNSSERYRIKAAVVCASTCKFSKLGPLLSGPSKACILPDAGLSPGGVSGVYGQVQSLEQRTPARERRAVGVPAEPFGGTISPGIATIVLRSGPRFEGGQF